MIPTALFSRKKMNKRTNVTTWKNNKEKNCVRKSTNNRNSCLAEADDSFGVYILIVPVTMMNYVV